MHSRRDFLKKLTASSVVLPLSGATAFAALGNYEDPTQTRVLRVAIMGLGSYGTRVANAMFAHSSNCHLPAQFYLM